jgi:hypothetical protein
MGREQLEALAKVISEQLLQGLDNAVVGTWTIRYDGSRSVFYFEKCEDGYYCEERPAVIAVSGEVLDRGGPLLVEES